MGRKGRHKLYQFVDDLVSIGTRDLVKQTSVPEPEARELMTGIAHALCAQYARTNMYVPAVLEIPLSARDEQIWNDYCAPAFGTEGSRPYTAQRIAEIAAAQELSERHVYSVVGLMRRREQARLQPALPGMEVVEA